MSSKNWEDHMYTVFGDRINIQTTCLGSITVNTHGRTLSLTMIRLLMRGAPVHTPIHLLRDGVKYAELRIKSLGPLHFELKYRQLGGGATCGT